MDVPTTQNPALVTDLEINLGICQHAFKFLPNTVSDKNSWDTFFLVVLPLSLSKLFIAVQSPNLVHQHWGDKETQKSPNNFDWDCRRILREMADCKQSTEDRSTYCTFSTFSRIKISPKEEMEGYFKLEQKIYIIQISLGSSLFSFNQGMVSYLKMSFSNKKQKLSTKARMEP